ncbi:MAG: phenylalanine--tRNA ligase beta subunit-related protein [Veillonellales bacterium]
MQITIHESIKLVIPKCRLGYVIVNDAVVRGTPPSLAQEFFKLQAEVAKVYNMDILKKIPRIIAVRSMYKKLDFDPSRYRPASEALVRRVLKNKGLYYMNSAVDVNNFCSIKFLLPFGIYDLDHIQGNVIYRLAPEGSYINMSGHTLSTNGKPFLSDEIGVFGNPTSDSKRTAINLSGRNLMSVIYADEEVSDDELEHMLEFTAEMLIRYNGGRIGEKKIIYA